MRGHCSSNDAIIMKCRHFAWRHYTIQLIRLINYYYNCTIFYVIFDILCRKISKIWDYYHYLLTDPRAYEEQKETSNYLHTQF